MVRSTIDCCSNRMATRRLDVSEEYLRYGSVPIIGVTDNCATSDIQSCLDSGMTAAIGKVWLCC